VKILHKYKQERNLLLAYIILVIVLSFTANGFLSLYNISTILFNFTLLGFIALGMVMVLIMGEIDLSVGSTIAATSTIFAYTAITLNLGIIIAAIAGLLVGTVGGFCTAFLRNKYKIPSFITSLGFFLIWRGTALVLTNSRTISGFKPSFSFLGSAVFFNVLPFSTIILILLSLIIRFILSKTSYGLFFYSVGSNEKLARLSGINANRIRYLGMIALGLLTSFSGIIITSNLMSATPMVGEGFEMLVIAGVILGGTSLSGGRGTVFGTLLGVLFLKTIESGLALLGIDPFLLIVFRGTIILLAVFSNTIQQVGIKGIDKQTIAISQE
jgi:ribose transport system permease protein